MKKLLSLIAAAIMLVSLTSCGTDNTVTDNQSTQTSAEATSENSSRPVLLSDSSNYDIDLASMSSTMVYSEVYAMVNEPDKYIGKKVRMAGQFALYSAFDTEGNPIPGQNYYACVIADATACCSQGIEFVLAGDYKYPQDYPDLWSDIVVSGIFNTYDEHGKIYCHLVDAVFE